MRKGMMDRELIAVKSISADDSAKREQEISELHVFAEFSGWGPSRLRVPIELHSCSSECSSFFGLWYD